MKRKIKSNFNTGSLIVMSVLFLVLLFLNIYPKPDALGLHFTQGFPFVHTFLSEVYINGKNVVDYSWIGLILDVLFCSIIVIVAGLAFAKISKKAKSIK